ncbi:cytochrome P450 [Rhizophagus irregularis]|uniref:Cytochrome P450 n=1 Tax=Rhizophagus irregularis TaxID=588596 RepID=A0A2N0P0B7_9GLOM|nr:cytochrome P450 [Rhizophagus irregularis]
MFVNVSSFLRHYVPFFKNKADDLLQNVRFINKRLDEIIKRRRQTIENTPLNEPLTNDMLTSLITANTSRDVNHTKTVGGEALNRPMTDTEIRGIIFDGFLGGTDTTANTISFVTYYLAHNQDVKKKLIEEIDRIFQGLRLCPGRKLAMIELVCLIALFYRKYEIDLVDMNAPLKVINGGVTACGELLTKIKHRK